MLTKLSGRLIPAVLVILCCVSFCFAQPQAETVDELKRSIQKLESIDQNPNISPEIKEINRTFLTEKRTALLALLMQKRSLRREYLSAATSALSTDQILKVQQEISDLNDAIKNLNSSLPGQTNSNTSRGETVTNPTSGSSENQVEVPSDHGEGEEVAITNAAAGVSRTTTPMLSTNSTAPTTSSISPANAVLQDPAPGGPVNPATQGDQMRALLGSAVQRIRTEKATNPTATIDLRNTFMLLAVSLTEKTRKDVVADFTAKAEDMKMDKQTGSSLGTGASTSLVAKAGIPAAFGFAVENGALTRTDSKTGITFSGTPVGMFEALSKKGFIESYQKDDGFDRFLRNFSFKISFDPNRGSTPGTFTGSGQQLSGYSVRYKIIDDRDPRDRKYTSQWSRLVENQAVPVTATLARFFTRLYTRPTPVFTAWRTETEAAVAAAAPADVEAVLVRQMEKLRKLDLGIEINSLISTFSNQFDDFLKSRDDILNQVNAGWISTIEYNNERRLALPSLSNIRFIAEKGAYNGSLDLTANASLTFLNSSIPGTNTNRLRDFRFAGQLDVPLGNVVTTGKFFLSFAGLYQRLLDDETLSNGTVMTQKGDIATGQVKLSIPIRGTAFKIPLSFSFANRTELIKEKHVKGSFGVTFDLDSIFAKFNPFTNNQ
jgi:hypothetical protein